MEMTDKEIYRSWQKASRKKTQIRILAELNDCDRKQIQEIIDRTEESMKKRGRPKKEYAKPGIPSAVLMAVRARVAELEEKTTDLKQAIEQKQKTFDWFMQEWAELKEWQQEHDTDISGQAI